MARNTDKVIIKRLADIVPYSRNPRNNEHAVDMVAASIAEFGFKNPIILDKNNVIIAGHTRYKAAQKLGYEEVPCIVAEDLTPAQVRAFRLADNKVAEAADWDLDMLKTELDGIDSIDMSDFGFDLDLGNDDGVDSLVDPRSPSVQHNVFENQERRQFYSDNYYGIPTMEPTQTITTEDKLLRFCDFNQVDDPENYIVHFYYDDFKFIQAWRDPDKYIERLRQFKAVISPDFSLYTDFPRALQILSCYRRQWCGAYWQEQGIDVIPDVVWGDKESYDYCFLGIPEGGTVAVSSVGVRRDPNWDGSDDDLFIAGYNEMMRRIKPSAIIFYGSVIDGLEGNIIRCPSFYELRRKNIRKKGE